MSDNQSLTQKKYVETVLETYVSLPETPNRPRRDDRCLAIQWHRQAIELFQVEAAMWLAIARRTFRDSELGELEPIRSLRYFVPLIEEIQHTAVDESYARYLQQKLSPSSVLGMEASSKPGAAAGDNPEQQNPTKRPA